METGKFRFSFMQVYRNLSERYPYSQKHKIEYEEGCPVRGSLLAIARRTHVISICIRRFMSPEFVESGRESSKRPGIFHKMTASKKGPQNLFWSPLLWFSKNCHAFLAISVSWVNAAASLTASSASILRLISTPATFRPCIKVE